MDPKNAAMQLLYTHFFLIEYVVGAQVLGPIIERSFPFRKRLTIAWLHRVRDNLDPKYVHYLDWPIQFAEAMIETDAFLADGVVVS
jgi:hypothetical protein